MLAQGEQPPEWSRTSLPSWTDPSVWSAVPECCMAPALRKTAEYETTLLVPRTYDSCFDASNAVAMSLIRIIRCIGAVGEGSRPRRR